jgi:hypothetical protein
MFNPFTQYSLMPFSNIQGSTPGFEAVERWVPSFMMGNRTLVYTAIPQQQETVTYWMQGGDGQYQQVSEAKAFAQDLWLHFVFDKPVVYEPVLVSAQRQGLTVYDGITIDQMREAVLSLPHAMETIAAGGYSEADVWAYAQHEAPWAVDLVGVAT